MMGKMESLWRTARDLEHLPSILQTAADHGFVERPAMLCFIKAVKRVINLP
jgi:hypothetical protein